MGLFDKEKLNKLANKAKETLKDVLAEPTKNELMEIEYYISSASYYQNQIENVVSTLQPINNRYIMETFSKNNTTIWKYDPCKIKDVKFEKEPNNEHDNNAIKIIVKTGLIGNVLIGYIPQEDNIQFKEWLNSGKIYNINLTIYGGENKTILENSVMEDKTNYKVTLKILVKK